MEVLKELKKAIGQPLDETVGVCRLRRSDYFLVGCVRLTHADIIPDTRWGQPGVLQYHSVVFTQGMACDTAYIRAVNGNPAARHIVKSH